jgi:copper(I)-binding protein
MRLKSLALAIAMPFFAGLDAGVTDCATSGLPSDSQLSFSLMQMRATAPGMPSSAAHVSIANHGDAADCLIAAKTLWRGVWKSTQWKWITA